MDYSQKKSHPFLILLLVILIGGAAFYSAQYIFNYPQKEKTPSETATTTSNVTTSRVDENKLPEGITSDMILEKGAPVIQKYTAIDKNHTRSQSTIQYLSTKNSQEIGKLVLTYFSEHTWGVEMYNIAQGIITGRKAGKQLIYSITKNTATGQNVVDVTLITIIPSQQ